MKNSGLFGILFWAQICFFADSAKKKEKQFVVFIVAAHLTLLIYLKTGLPPPDWLKYYVLMFVCFCVHLILFQLAGQWQDKVAHQLSSVKVR